MQPPSLPELLTPHRCGPGLGPAYSACSFQVNNHSPRSTLGQYQPQTRNNAYQATSIVWGSTPRLHLGMRRLQTFHGSVCASAGSAAARAVLKVQRHTRSSTPRNFEISYCPVFKTARRVRLRVVNSGSRDAGMRYARRSELSSTLHSVRLGVGQLELVTVTCRTRRHTSTMEC